MTWRNSRSAVGGVAVGLALALALTGAPAAVAKEEIVSVVVCGETRCGAVPELDAGAATTITQRGRTAPVAGAPFYDVFLVFREPGAGRTSGGVLRYVPSMPAIRSTRSSGEPLWFRTDRDLARALDRAARGVDARPARRLERPSSAISNATAAARSAIAVGGAGTTRSPADDDASVSGRTAAIGVGAAILVLVGVALMGRRRVTPTFRPRR
jgi:hypothetical protein